MDHLTLENMYDYVTHKMADNDAFLLEDHLSACDKCTRKVYLYRYILENFNEIWDSLTLEQVAKEALEIRLLESLVDANLEPTMLKRLKTWVKDFYQKTQFVMGIMRNATQKTAEIMHEGLADVVQHRQIPQFTPVGYPARVLGEVSEEETPGRSQQVKKLGPNGEIIDIFYSNDTIQFKIKPITFKYPAPLLWLFPVKEGTSIVRETYRPAETDYLVAEISTHELKDLSHYLIFLEHQETRSD
jgi:hypothetical protein